MGRPSKERRQREDHVGARCAEWPQSASVLPRTAGQSPRRCHQTGQPVRWEHQESVLCQHLISTRLSQSWCSWTSKVDIACPRDRAMTFITRRVKSVTKHSSCINLGSVLPSCICLVPWLGELAGSQWHAGQRWPGLQHCK